MYNILYLLIENSLAIGILENYKLSWSIKMPSILVSFMKSSLKFSHFNRYIQHRVCKNNSDKDFRILMIEATVLLHNIFYVSTSNDKIPNGIWKRWKCIYSRYLPDDIIYVTLITVSIHK